MPTAQPKKTAPGRYERLDETDIHSPPDPPVTNGATHFITYMRVSLEAPLQQAPLVVNPLLVLPLCPFLSVLLMPLVPVVLLGWLIAQLPLWKRIGCMGCTSAGEDVCGPECQPTDVLAPIERLPFLIFITVFLSVALLPFLLMLYTMGQEWWRSGGS
jgi:hypothetical protein